MKAASQRAIDALHAQIAALVAAEKAHHDATHPGEVGILRTMTHTRIDCAARSPADRSQMRWAVAAFPAPGVGRGA